MTFGAISLGSYRERLIAYYTANQVPLDFFSRHRHTAFSYDLYDFARAGSQVRRTLDAAGFRNAENIVDEWNMTFVKARTPGCSSVMAATEERHTPSGRLSALTDTPERLAVVGADNLWFAVLAGRSADGTSVQVLISNYEIPQAYRDRFLGTATRAGLPQREGIRCDDNRGFHLTIRRLPRGDG